jgi:hypothetical protein
MTTSFEKKWKGKRRQKNNVCCSKYLGQNAHATSYCLNMGNLTYNISLLVIK